MTQLSALPPSAPLARTAQGTDLAADVDETFRRLYIKLEVDFDALNVLAVTSAVAREGKTTVALGLARTLAHDFPDRRIAFVETDPIRSVIALDLGIPAAPGLLEVLRGEVAVEEACRRGVVENLHVLPVGGPALNPTRLFRSGAASTAFAALREQHDMVVFDMPALLANSDAQLLAELADATLLVVRAALTPSGLVSQAAEMLRGNLRAVVLNDARSAIPPLLRRFFGWYDG